MANNQQALADISTGFYDLMYGAEDQACEFNDFEIEVKKSLDQLLSNEEKLLKRIPTLPKALIKLINALNQPEVDFAVIEDVVLEDLKLATEIVRISNTPLFRRTQEPIKSIGQAISILGINGVGTIATTAMMKNVMTVKPIYFKLFGKLIWSHSLECAIIAKKLASPEEAFQAYLLGLIHDTGKIVIFQCITEAFSRVLSSSKPSSKLFRISMTESSLCLSYLVAREWRLPENLTQALNQQNEDEDERSSLGDVLYQANIFSEIYHLIKNQYITIDEGIEILEESGLDTDQMFSIYQQLEEHNSTTT